MIPKGTEIAFVVNGTTGQFVPRTVAGVRQDAIGQMSAFLNVKDVTFETDEFLKDPLHYALWNWRYTANVRAVTLFDHAAIDDVDAIVAGAFQTAAGDRPTVTASGFERGQGEDTTRGISLTTVLVLGVVALVALAVVKFE